MDVEHPPLEGGDEARRQDPHEAREANEVDFAGPQSAEEGLAVGSTAASLIGVTGVTVGSGIDEQRLHARPGCHREGAAGRLVGEHGHDRGIAQLTTTGSIQQGAGVGTGTGGEDGDAGGHGREDTCTDLSLPWPKPSPGQARPGQTRTRATSFATSLGSFATATPAARKASALAAAVPFDPETRAPAWPIRLPGGAVKPAM